MFYYLSTWWRWLCRCKYSRGFGVQSPSAYSFIRYVINEHYPYYAYSELEERYEMPGRLQHKLGRLLFRLANYWQPEKCYSIESLYFPYINAGCYKTVLCTLYDLYDSSTKNLVVIDLDHIDKDELYSSILPFCNDRTLLVVLGLNHGKTSSFGIDCNIPNILELPTICIMPESSFLINQNTSNIIKLIFKIKGLPHRMDGQPFLS